MPVQYAYLNPRHTRQRHHDEVVDVVVVSVPRRVLYILRSNCISQLLSRQLTCHKLSICGILVTCDDLCCNCFCCNCHFRTCHQEGRCSSSPSEAGSSGTLCEPSTQVARCLGFSDIRGRRCDPPCTQHRILRHVATFSFSVALSSNACASIMPACRRSLSA